MNKSKTLLQQKLEIQNRITLNKRQIYYIEKYNTNSVFIPKLQEEIEALEVSLREIERKLNYN